MTEWPNADGCPVPADEWSTHAITRLGPPTIEELLTDTNKSFEKVEVEMSTKCRQLTAINELMEKETT